MRIKLAFIEDICFAGTAHSASHSELSRFGAEAAAREQHHHNANAVS